MTPSTPVSSPHIALSVRAHDRVGTRRTDQAWLDQTWADPATRVVPVARDRFPTSATGDAVDWCRPADAPPGQRIFLGTQHGIARFAVLVAVSAADGGWQPLREVAPRLSAEDLALLVHAVALAEWHIAHRYCPRCGGRLDPGQAGHVLTCTQCGRQHFPRTDPAVIMLVTDGDRALLARQPQWPEGRYSTLAGFVDPGESLESAVVREVAEETGVEVTDVRYFGNQPWPFPASLMVGFFARAVTTAITVDGEEISEARWFTREELDAETAAGRLLLPGSVSISRSLVEAWYGGPLPGTG